MFIPDITYNKKFEPNDQVVLIKDYSSSFGLFTKGHEFTIISNDTRDYNNREYTIMDNDLNIKIDNVDKSYLRYIIDPFTAKKIANKRQYIKNVNKIIKQKCPHKTIQYDHRDEYTGCKVKDATYTYLSYDFCKPCIDCLEYFDNDIINNDTLLLSAYRQYKIKKLKLKLSSK